MWMWFVVKWRKPQHQVENLLLFGIERIKKRQNITKGEALDDKGCPRPKLV
jgi:hypothetical protein